MISCVGLMFKECGEQLLPHQMNVPGKRATTVEEGRKEGRREGLGGGWRKN
jgi:hypothetical protein